jgi:hypothetical protein
MVINESSFRKKRWEEVRAVTIDEIIEQIRNGTAKIYRNKITTK